MKNSTRASACASLIVAISASVGIVRGDGGSGSDDRIAQLLAELTPSAVEQARQEGVRETIAQLGEGTDPTIQKWYALCERHGLAALYDVEARLGQADANARGTALRALAPFVARRSGAPIPDARATELATLLALRALQDSDAQNRIRAVTAVASAVRLPSALLRPIAIENLAGLLGDAERDVRLAAAKALRDLGAADRVPSVLLNEVKEQ